MIANNGIFNGSLRVLGSLFCDSIVGNINGNINGNANTASTLLNARYINGTAFNGERDIITSKWGNSRTITLTGAVTGTLTTDGSANATLSTAEGNVSFKRLGSVDATTDWNSLTDPGCYKVQMTSWGDAGTYHSPNQYGTVYQYGLLVVFKSGVAAEDRAVQIYFPHNAGTIVTRMANGGGWQVWTPLFKGITKDYIGLGNVDNTADAKKNVLSAAKWTTERTLNIGNAKLKVNGEKDVTCTISDIGAVAKTGDTMLGPLKNNYVTGTWLSGNQGNALLSSSVSSGGSFISLMRYPSTNGYFCISGYQNSLYATYTSKTKVDAGTNSTDRAAVLLNESGNSTFPGTVSAGSFSGSLNGTATNAAADASNQNISSTYIKTISAAGKTLTITKGNGTTSTLTTQDTLNTAGSTNSASKLFLIGAASQANNSITYSRSTCYIAADGCLYSNGIKVSDINHTHSYLPLTGGTLTGPLTIPSVVNGSNVPLASSTVSGLSDLTGIKTYPTYLGSVTDADNVWYNMISTRHRNGSGDGTSYGMYIVSKLTTGGDLIWNKQTASSAWQGERTLLDSGNYNSYAPKKTGDGATGTWNISITGGASTAGKATQDSAGQQINTTYLKGITASGRTLTLTKGNGATNTITTQDTMNTAGSTTSTQKLYLIGAPYQSASAQTYTNPNFYINNDTLTVKEICLDYEGTGLRPGTSGVNIGQSTSPFGNVYAYNFNGDLNGKLVNSRTIDGVKFDAGSNITHYGTCSTASGTAAKVVSLANFSLATGARISVKFTYSNTYSSPTLNVNGTGAKYMKAFSSTSAPVYYWYPGSVIDFVYDGSYWVMTDASYATTTYYGRVKLSDTYSSTVSGVGIAASQTAVYNAYNTLNTKLSSLGDQITITVSNGVCRIERK